MTYPLRSSSRDADIICATRGLRMRGKVRGLSSDGCMLDAGAGLLRKDDRVTLVFDCGVKVTGRVVFDAPSAFRLSFDPPLHPAVLVHISEAAQHSAGDEAPVIQAAWSPGRRAV